MDESQSTDVPEEAGQTEPTDEAVVAAEAEQSEIPSLPIRLFNVFLSPGKVMEAVAKDPVWVGALLVGAVRIAMQTALISFDWWLETVRWAAPPTGAGTRWDSPGLVTGPSRRGGWVSRASPREYRYSSARCASPSWACWSRSRSRPTSTGRP